MVASLILQFGLFVLFPLKALGLIIMFIFLKLFKFIYSEEVYEKVKWWVFGLGTIVMIFVVSNNLAHIYPEFLTNVVTSD